MQFSVGKIFLKNFKTALDIPHNVRYNDTIKQGTPKEDNTMKYNLSEIMSEAWRIKRETGITIGQALKVAWANAKLDAAEGHKMAPVEVEMHYGAFKGLKHVSPKKGSYNADNKHIVVVVEAIEYYSAKLAALIESFGFGEVASDLVAWCNDLFGANWRTIIA